MQITPEDMQIRLKISLEIDSTATSFPMVILFKVIDGVVVENKYSLSAPSLNLQNIG
jgi:hypothetical protein